MVTKERTGRLATLLPPLWCLTLIRAGALLRRQLTRLAEQLPYFPDPDAKCPAHGTRFCRPCSANPADCVGDVGGCGYWLATGMHWDTCPNRKRGGR